MNVFQKLFSTHPKDSIRSPQNFLDCLNVVRVWSAQASTNPDISINDTQLQSALSTHVSCPYCSQQYTFGRAVQTEDMYIRVQCPYCHASPNDEIEEEWGYV